MTHIKKTYKIKKLDDLEISKRMRKDKLYYHCCQCGKIYEDKNRNILILDITKLNGGRPSIPREFEDYKITSGICRKCYEEVKIWNHGKLGEHANYQK